MSLFFLLQGKLPSLERVGRSFDQHVESVDMVSSLNLDVKCDLSLHDTNDNVLAHAKVVSNSVTV